MTKLTIEDLKEVLAYDPTTGWFTWKIKTKGHAGSILPGDRAGCVATGDNYSWRQIGYKKRIYRESRLAWAFMTGDWPPKGFDVEHKNEDGTVNKWDNLRLATRGQNIHNRAKPKTNNTSGCRGVSPRPDGRWLARITVDGKIIHLGHHLNKDDAIAARLSAERRYLGDFAPVRE
jgi:hypothetical protein